MLQKNESPPGEGASLTDKCIGRFAIGFSGFTFRAVHLIIIQFIDEFLAPISSTISEYVTSVWGFCIPRLLDRGVRRHSACLWRCGVLSFGFYATLFVLFKLDKCNVN